MPKQDRTPQKTKSSSSKDRLLLHSSRFLIPCIAWVFVIALFAPLFVKFHTFIKLDLGLYEGSIFLSLGLGVSSLSMGIEFSS